MCPSPLRLKRRQEFLAVGHAGYRLSSEGVVLQALRRDDDGPVRVGYTVTRKVGNAVVRNRARRRLREIARLALAERTMRGLDLVLIGRRATLLLPFSRLRAELDRALDRIEGLLMPPRSNLA